MNHYIQIKDGQPIGHPMLEEHFLESYPEEDINNLSEKFAKFNRLPSPQNSVETEAGFYQTWQESYVKNGDVWESKWTLRDLTEEEKQFKIMVTMPHANYYKESLILLANHIIQSSNNQSEIEAWSSYIDTLNNFEITDPDHMNFHNHFPRKPIFIKQNNKWVNPSDKPTLVFTTITP